MRRVDSMAGAGTHLSPSDTLSELNPPPVALPMVRTPLLWGTFSIMRPSYLQQDPQGSGCNSLQSDVCWDDLISSLAYAVPSS